LGGFLSELGDVCSDPVLYLPFALVPGVAAPLLLPPRSGLCHFVLHLLVSVEPGLCAQRIFFGHRH